MPSSEVDTTPLVTARTLWADPPTSIPHPSPPGTAIRWILFPHRGRNFDGSPVGIISGSLYQVSAELLGAQRTRPGPFLSHQDHSSPLTLGLVLLCGSCVPASTPPPLLSWQDTWEVVLITFPPYPRKPTSSLSFLPCASIFRKKKVTRHWCQQHHSKAMPNLTFVPNE